MNIKRYKKVFTLIVCLLLVITACGIKSEYKMSSLQGNGGKNKIDKATPKPEGSGGNDEISSKPALTVEDTKASGGAVEDGKTQDPGSSSPEDPGISSGGGVTDEQKTSYEELAVDMEAAYEKIVSEAALAELEDSEYEDYRYFGPLYEYYHGIREEQYENITAEEMEEFIAGIREYLEELKNFSNK